MSSLKSFNLAVYTLRELSSYRLSDSLNLPKSLNETIFRLYLHNSSLSIAPNPQKSPTCFCNCFCFFFLIKIPKSSENHDNALSSLRMIKNKKKRTNNKTPHPFSIVPSFLDETFSYRAFERNHMIILHDVANSCEVQKVQVGQLLLPKHTFSLSLPRAYVCLLSRRGAKSAARNEHDR